MNNTAAKTRIVIKTFKFWECFSRANKNWYWKISELFFSSLLSILLTSFIAGSLHWVEITSSGLIFKKLIYFFAQIILKLSLKKPRSEPVSNDRICCEDKLQAEAASLTDSLAFSLADERTLPSICTVEFFRLNYPK